MSVEFEIRTRLKKLGTLDELIAQWRSAIDVPHLVERAGDNHAWVFAPGQSIRGCTLRSETKLLGSALHLRLSVAASSADWRIAFAFLRLAKTRGAAILAEDETSLAAEDLSDAIAELVSRDAFRRDGTTLQHMLRTEDSLTLPNLRFSIAITRDDLLSNEQLQNLEATLMSRTARYRDARVASAIVLPSGRIAAVWSGEALLTSACDDLIFPAALDDPDPGDYLSLPWSDAIEKLGAVAERVEGQEPSYYLRALDANSAADVEIWAALAKDAKVITPQA